MNSPQKDQSASLKQRAGQLFRQGRLKQARQVYEKICAEYDTDAESQYMLGSIHGQLGQYEQAVRYLQNAIRLSPKAIVAHCGLGAACKQLGRFPEAAQAFHTAHRLNPRDADILIELAGTLIRLDKPGDARKCLQQALILKPDSVEALAGLGQTHHMQREAREAAAYYERALKIDPQQAVTHNRLGHALHLLGQYQDAISHFRQATGIRPRFAEAWKNLGFTLTSDGQVAEARDAFDKALKINPQYTDAAIGQIELLILEGKYEDAGRLLKSLVRRGVRRTALATAWISICRHCGDCQAALDYAGEILAGDAIAQADEEKLRFALGRLHDARKEYDKAFQQYQRGNDLKPDTFDEVELLATTDSLIKVFNWQFLSTAPRSTLRSAKPVFILGMPRSGTTLTEQILCSHPDVYGAGELKELSKLVSSLPSLLGAEPGYPNNLARLSAPLLDRLAGDYLQHIEKLAPDALRVTDKMPHNFQHAGLIAMLFPGARIIHCVRDPLDTCLSIYFQNFTDAHNYASHLGHLGVYYRQYERLMNHYRSLLDIPILDVRYEDLVSSQEEVSRRMIDFIGLDWDERCLRFHETDRFITTCSYDQVRQPIYSGSIRRWRNYERYLGPLVEALGDRP